MTNLFEKIEKSTIVEAGLNSFLSSKKIKRKVHE